MTALYLERYLNFGLTLEELQSGKPIIGIAQTGSDLSPCNRHHLVLAERVREGIREAGGIAIEFPVHPIQETGKRPTAGLDRNLAYLGLVEVLYGYPLDGVVLTIGCDKTTPACLMAAATVNIPAIALSVGPMLNGWHKGERTGSGTIVWKAREMLAAGEIDDAGFIKLVAIVGAVDRLLQHDGHRDDDELAGRGARHVAARLGRDPRAVSRPAGGRLPAPASASSRWCAEDLKPSDILTARRSSTRSSSTPRSAARPTRRSIWPRSRATSASSCRSTDWQDYGHKVPLLVNLQPAGEYLGEDYYRAGGVPAVVAQLMGQGLIREDALTVNGRTIGENCRGATIEDEKVIRPFDQPLKEDAGLHRAVAAICSTPRS